MKVSRIIGTLIFLSGYMNISTLYAAEVLYSPEENNVEQSKTQAQFELEKSEIWVNPKFVDDADLNFDEIMLEDMSDEEKNEDSNSVRNGENTNNDNLPILQKNESDILPTQIVKDIPQVVPEQPLDNKGESSVENKSLTEVISETKQSMTTDENEEKDEDVVPLEVKNNEESDEKNEQQETWINKLKAPLSALSSNKENASLEGLLTTGGKRKSNASVFDISGAMLRMSGQQVDDALKKRGFQKIYQKFDIPNFIRWRNEENCRNRGVAGYERLQSCVVEMAKKENHQYVALTKYSKFSTKEEISVSYTSNFTNNKVYRITYKSMSPGIIGNSPKALYLRNIKIYDFWKRINQKYGAPDNKEDVTWGLGSNKPYMRASTGFLLLEDPMLRELDYTRMSREDQRYMNTDIYSF